MPNRHAQELTGWRKYVYDCLEAFKCCCCSCFTQSAVDLTTAGASALGGQNAATAVSNIGERLVAPITAIGDILIDSVENSLVTGQEAAHPSNNPHPLSREVFDDIANTANTGLNLAGGIAHNVANIAALDSTTRRAVNTAIDVTVSTAENLVNHVVNTVETVANTVEERGLPGAIVHATEDPHGIIQRDVDLVNNVVNTFIPPRLISFEADLSEATSEATPYRPNLSIDTILDNNHNLLDPLITTRHNTPVTPHPTMGLSEVVGLALKPASTIAALALYFMGSSEHNIWDS